MTTAKTPELIDETFTAAITTEPNSGCTCVVMPASGDVFATRNAVKVAGTIDGKPFQATLLPMGEGTQMVPVCETSPPPRQGVRSGGSSFGWP